MLPLIVRMYADNVHISLTNSDLIFTYLDHIYSPYYIWLGRPRSCDTSQFTHAFEVEGGNTVGNYSPRSIASSPKSHSDAIPVLEIGSPLIAASLSKPQSKETLVDIVPPLSSFHYQVKKVYHVRCHPKMHVF